MTGTRVSSIEKLLRASSSDEETMLLPVPDAAFGFHAQQAMEKLMKALLVSRTGTHPFSHDLLSLRKGIEKTGLALPRCPFPIERLTEYAGDARYDDPIPVNDDERKVIRECVVVLRLFVMREVGLEDGEASGV